MGFDFGRIAERKIEEAIADGLLDDLPGKGKPLVFEDDPMTPQHLRIANRILKNAGVLPDWMQLEQEIERARTECAKSYDKVSREYARRRAKLDAPSAGRSSAYDPEELRNRRSDFAAWLLRSREAYAASLQRVNRDIIKLDLMGPSARRVQIPYRVREELDRFDAEMPPLQEN